MTNAGRNLAAAVFVALWGAAVCGAGGNDCDLQSYLASQQSGSQLDSIDYGKIRRLLAPGNKEAQRILRGREEMQRIVADRGGSFELSQDPDDPDGENTRTLAIRSSTRESLLEQGISEETIQALHGIEVYRITKLPRPGRNSYKEIALRHPKMKEALQNLEKMGQQLVIDPGITLMADGMYVGGRIHIGPRTPWHVFVHEYQHALFSESGLELFYELGLDAAKEGLKAEEIFSPNELKNFRARGLEVDELLRSLNRQLPMRAANESGAVAAELRDMGFHRLTKDGIESKIYALDWQIVELSRLKDRRTKVQEARLRRALVEKELLLNSEKNLKKAARIVAIGAPVAVAVGVAAAIYYQDRGQKALIPMPNGSYRALSVDDILRQVQRYSLSK